MSDDRPPAAGAASTLQKIWYAPARPPWLLRCLSSIFGLVVGVRAAAYRAGVLRSRRIDVPVIVVGNLAVGGTGKTPLVIWLAAQLEQAGRRPGIVLRGYGGSASRGPSPRLVSDDSDPAEVGDEALLLRLRTQLPVAVHRDRAMAALRLREEAVDVIVSDDGLQHLRLARDFEIAVIDAARGLGNGYLLPAGPLREPSERLRRTDCVVLNGQCEAGARSFAMVPTADIPTLTMQLTGDRLQSLSGRLDSRPLSQLSGQRVHAVAGIGNPMRFFRRLRAAGLEVLEHPFPDHHRYRLQELAFGDGLPVLMTEKDAVKCRGLAVVDGWYLPVSASFDAPQSKLLMERLATLLRR